MENTLLDSGRMMLEEERLAFISGLGLWLVVEGCVVHVFAPRIFTGNVIKYRIASIAMKVAMQQQALNGNNKTNGATQSILSLSVGFLADSCAAAYEHCSF